MGVFSHFKETEQRLDALEDHVRALTEVVQQSQMDIATGVVALLALQAQVDEKVSASDVDPIMKELNEKLGVVREQYHRAADAAGESWATMQTGVQEAIGTLRESAEKARQKIAES